MTDFYSIGSINLGRWGGAQVRIHLLFLLFVPAVLLNAALATGHPVGQTAGWLLLLVVAVVLHELGHAAMAAWLGAEPEDVRLWPLGNFVGPSPALAARPDETIWVACAGLSTSFVLAFGSAIVLNFAGATMVWNPFGNVEGTGAPILAADKLAAPFTWIWWVGWFGFLNLVILLTNLLPALPMDGGRILRGVLASPAVGQPRDSMVAPYFAWAVAAVLMLAGLARLVFSGHAGRHEGGMTLIGLAVLFYLIARTEARLVEEGGFFDDNVFGYDFSEGYSSLEGSAQKVRPYRESALRRWRRSRSELRRQQRLARAAAEEQRMDEILAKLHSQGRAALTDEEQRFLVRVSLKYRNRSKTRE